MFKNLLRFTVTALIFVICTAMFIFVKAGDDRTVNLKPLPTAAPTPTPKPDYALMETELTNRLSEKAGDWSLYFCDYTNGDEISINSHQVYSASLIKLFVAEEAYKRIYEGSLKDTQNTEGLLYRMITYSDNDAWSSLARLIGGGSYTNGMNAVTRLAQGEGFADTGQFFKGTHKNFNFTSVNDCGLYLKRILNGEIISPEISNQILSLLKQQQHTQKIPSGVPEGVETANKTGELEYVQGDAAIIYAPSRTYILVIIGDSLGDSYGQIPFFGELSEYIYYFTEGTQKIEEDAPRPMPEITENTEQ